MKLKETEKDGNRFLFLYTHHILYNLESYPQERWVGFVSNSKNLGEQLH